MLVMFLAPTQVLIVCLTRFSVFAPLIAGDYVNMFKQLLTSVFASECRTGSAGSVVAARRRYSIAWTLALSLPAG